MQSSVRDPPPLPSCWQGCFSLARQPGALSSWLAGRTETLIVEVDIE